MAESSDVQALEKISSEVGESQIKITLSNQCIKAQAYLVDKLKKQIERQKEICSFISNSNFKLQAEIKQAELEVKSLIIAQNTIKSGNIELKKEFLLAKEKKSEIAERVSNGEKKYEALWLESKERYESIPFVRKLLQATSKAQVLRENIVALENQSQTLEQEIKTKKDFFAKLDRNRVIELAEYLVNVLPKTLMVIQKKSAAIDCLSQEIDMIAKDQETVVSKHFDKIAAEQDTVSNKDTMKLTNMDNGWSNISSNNDRDVITMPRLQIIHSDFDALNAKLEQIKNMKLEVLNTISAKRVNPDEHGADFTNKKIKHDEFSIFFNNRTTFGNNAEEEKKDDSYSRKKLINILEDVKLDRNDAYKLVSKVNVESLKGVNMIGENVVEENCEFSNANENEKIEEIDLTKVSPVNTSILIPPTQFLDLSQEKLFSNSQVEVIVTMSMTEPTSTKLSQSLKNSQESIGKKRVSFDLPLSIQEISDTENNEINNNDEIANETIDTQIDTSLVSDENYTKIKDLILKKHNLDISPQFTYAKSKMTQMNSDEKIITSKFFQSDKTNVIEDRMIENQNIKGKISNSSKELENEKCSQKEATENANEGVMDVDQVVLPRPKANENVKTERVVSGLLFNHGTQGILDSLNVSMSTTGFDEGDTDFPHCIDSSLLLSPKADIPLPMSGDHTEVTSQEVPNFLSGLRKTGLSFFGQSAVTEPKSDTSGQNQESNFNFNFGGGEQKSRGGLFSMFR